MKYLLKYKIFESIHEELSQRCEEYAKNLESDIKDILDPLEIDGFKCVVSLTRSGSYGVITIDVNIYHYLSTPIRSQGSIKKAVDHFFTYSQIKDSVSHLISFLKDKGYKVTSTKVISGTQVHGDSSTLRAHGELDIPNGEKMRILKLLFEI